MHQSSTEFYWTQNQIHFFEVVKVIQNWKFLQCIYLFFPKLFCYCCKAGFLWALTSSTSLVIISYFWSLLGVPTILPHCLVIIHFGGGNYTLSTILILPIFILLIEVMEAYNKWPNYQFINSYWWRITGCCGHVITWAAEVQWRKKGTKLGIKNEKFLKASNKFKDEM